MPKFNLYPVQSPNREWVVQGEVIHSPGSGDEIRQNFADLSCAPSFKTEDEALNFVTAKQMGK